MLSYFILYSYLHALISIELKVRNTNIGLCIHTLASRDFHPLHKTYGTWKWDIIESITPDAYDQAQDYQRHGIVGYDFIKKIRNRGINDDSLPLLELFMMLWPGNWKEQQVGDKLYQSTIIFCNLFLKSNSFII